MPVQRWSGFPQGSDDGYREWVTGETPTAAEFNADRYDALATHARANVSGMTSDPTCTASGLVVTVPVGTSWYARVGWEVVTSAVTVTVSDDTDTWLFCCSDGNIRGSASASPPAGFDAETSCLLCKVSAAGGTATVLNGERWFAKRRTGDRLVTDGPLAIDHANDVASVELLDLPQRATPGTPTNAVRLYAKEVAGQPEAFVMSEDGTEVQLTSAGAVLASDYLRLDGTSVLTGGLRIGGSGDDVCVIVFRAPDVLIGPGEHHGSVTIREFPGTEVYDCTGLVFVDAYNSVHNLTDEFGLIAARGCWWGLGSDGVCDFDGTSTVLGLVPASGVYTLTRSIYPSSMTVRSGVTLVSRGYEIICSGTVTITGTIHADGNNGSDGTAIGGAGTAGGLIATVDVGGSQAGGLGGAGQTGTGSNSSALTNHSHCIIGAVTGGTGGGGGAGASGSGGSGGAGGAAQYRPYRRYTGHIIGGATVLTGGPGGRGGGGGGGDGTNKGGGGGGGGSGGGVVHICAQRIVFDATGVVRANGGNGGNGGSPSAGNCGGGGGGGGGGAGAVILAAESFALGGTILAAGGTGGTGGTPSGTGAAGSNGTNGPDGLILKINLRTGGEAV